MCRQGGRALDQCHGVNKCIQSLFILLQDASLLSLCNRSQPRITKKRCGKPAHLCPSAHCNCKPKTFEKTLRLLHHVEHRRAREAARQLRDTARRRSWDAPPPHATPIRRRLLCKENPEHTRRRAIEASHAQPSGHIAVSDISAHYLDLLGHSG